MFEHPIGSMKWCLWKAIGKAWLSFEELATTIAEVETILNLRPLSYVLCEDTDEQLRPSHFLIGRRSLSLPDGLFCEDDGECVVTRKGLTRRIRHLNSTMEGFWKRWRTKYLLELRESH